MNPLSLPGTSFSAVCYLWRMGKYSRGRRHFTLNISIYDSRCYTHSEERSIKKLSMNGKEEGWWWKHLSYSFKNVVEGREEWRGGDSDLGDATYIPSITWMENCSVHKREGGNEHWLEHWNVPYVLHTTIMYMYSMSHEIKSDVLLLLVPVHSIRSQTPRL